MSGHSDDYCVVYTLPFLPSCTRGECGKGALFTRYYMLDLVYTSVLKVVNNLFSSKSTPIIFERSVIWCPFVCHIEKYPKCPLEPIAIIRTPTRSGNAEGRHTRKACMQGGLVYPPGALVARFLCSARSYFVKPTRASFFTIGLPNAHTNTKGRYSTGLLPVFFFIF